MERPHSSHKRTLSVKTATAADTKHTPATAIALFVKNIRLLNLDLLDDWPVITPNTFSNQDARARIRCAEWSLFQLFRLYDPATTTDKLQPFFPPLEPLQSINLRAALYRCLNELKKNGVLGRETVLRKSMLDECQGDKFWELCLSFSAIVLRKIITDSRNGLHTPLAERYGNAQALGKSQRDSMLPLAIAHRAALTKVLSEKERKRQRFSRLFNVFANKDVDLQDRKLQVQERGRVRSQQVAIAQEVLQKDWVGSDELRDALRDGDDAPGDDSLLTKDFDSVWKINEQNRLFWRDNAEVGLLEQLENRTRQQRRRLQKWQNFHEKLMNARPPSSSGSVDSGKAFPFAFDKHQNLTLRDMEDNPQPPPSPQRHQKHDSVMKYDEILTAMREELRMRTTGTHPSAAVQEAIPAPRSRPQSFRKSSIDVNGGISGHHQRTHSGTAVPVRPMFVKRTSSRSYQQPKVVSQREPIPLKSGIFSPLKTTRRTSMSPASSGRRSLLASPVEDPHQGNAEGLVNGTHDSGLGASNTPTRSNSGTSTPVSAETDSAIEIPSKIIQGVGRVRPSLADRTRMSMAFRNSDEINGILQDPDMHLERSESPQPLQHTMSDPQFGLDRRTTLHERTRQSISLAPSTTVPLKFNKRPAHARSRTSLYPVNQFETPDKANRRSTITMQTESPTRNRDVTPREKLFEQDAEYSSIFKARPKIALSPIVSPDLHLDVAVSPMDNSGSMNLDDIAISSPLVRIRNEQ